jgi:hypothetical protein
MMTDRTTRRPSAWCALALASTLTIAGCSGAGGEPSPAETTVASGPATSASASAGPSAAPTAAPSSASSGTTPAADPSATGAPAQALASREFTVTGTYSKTRVRMRLDVEEIKRRGDLLDLTASLTNLEQDLSRDLRWQVSSRFEGSFREDLASTDGSFSGAVLTDIAGKKRYLVAADSGRACVCTVQLSSTFVGAGQSVELSATYAAPPTSTSTLDVTIASLGTFRDLPVS